MNVFEIFEQAPVLLKNWVLSLLASFGVPAWLLAVISAVIIIGTVIGVFLGLFALCSVMERKILARVQNRYGPNRVGPWGLFQPIADGIKMITKEGHRSARGGQAGSFPRAGCHDGSGLDGARDPAIRAQHGACRARFRHPLFLRGRRGNRSRRLHGGMGEQQ